MSDRGAAGLWRLGLRPGDRALFQMRHYKELVYAFFACLKIGVIPICTLAAHRSREIGYLGKHARAKAHFVHAGDTARFDMVAFAQKAGEDELTVGEIGAFLAAQGLAKFKWPERIELVEELPMTTSGKVSKPLMRELIASKLRGENAHVVAWSGGRAAVRREAGE